MTLDNKDIADDKSDANNDIDNKQIVHIFEVGKIVRLNIKDKIDRDKPIANVQGLNFPAEFSGRNNETKVAAIRSLDKFIRPVA